MKGIFLGLEHHPQEVLVPWQGQCQVVQLLWLLWDVPEECPVDPSGWGPQDAFNQDSFNQDSFQW